MTTTKDDEKMSIRLPNGGVSNSRFFSFLKGKSGTRVKGEANIRPSATKQLSRCSTDRSKLQQLSELELLKKMKSDIVSRLEVVAGKDQKLQNDIRAALNDVWTTEYTLLKQRLKKTSIKAKSEKMRVETTRALESMVVTKNEHKTEFQDSDDFDVRETALWLVNNFLPKATVDDIVNKTKDRMEGESGDEGGGERVQARQVEKLSGVQKLRRCARRVMVALIIQKTKLNSTISLLSHHDQLKSCLTKIGEWDFNVFEMYDIDVCKEQCLVLATHHILVQLDMVRALDISHRKLWNFLRDVEVNYNNIPYHNKLHALDVTNTLYFVLKSEFMQNHLSKLDQMAAIIAACVHDLGHDGYNNAFHMSSGSDIALTYNDSSVLEHYHISRAFFLLKKTNNNWYQKLSRPIRNYFRNVIIQLVLATDMHFHFQELARLRAMSAAFKQETKSKTSSTPQSNGDKLNSTPSQDTSDVITPMSERSNLELDIPPPTTPLSSFSIIPLEKSKANYNLAHTAIKNEELTTVLIPEKQVETESSRVSGVEDERLFILGAAIHICDISNPTKGLKVCTQWADRIMEEFFNQGDKEKALGLPVSPMMDRETASLASGQIGFIRFIVAPIFDVFCDIIPELKPWSQVMQLNLEHWETTHKQQKNVRTQKRISKSKLEMQSQPSTSGNTTPTPTLGSSTQLSNGFTDNNKLKKDTKKTNVPETIPEILNK